MQNQDNVAELKWMRIAREGVSRLNAVVHGGILKNKRVIANDLGVTLGTLHNYITAFNFIMSIEKEYPLAAAAMRRYPAAVVGAYSRWFKHAPAEAMGHAASAQGMRMRAILAAEKAARQAGGWQNKNLLETVWPSVQEKAAEGPDWIFAGRGSNGGAPDFSLLELHTNADAISKEMGAHAALVAPSFQSIAVIEVRRGADHRITAVMAKDTVGRATVAAMRHALVILLFDDLEAVHEFRDSLPSVFHAYGVRNGCLNFGGGIVAPMAANRLIQCWSSL